MTKEEMEGLLKGQVSGITDFVNGYKACAKFVVDNWEKVVKETDGAGTTLNPTTPENA